MQKYTQKEQIAAYTESNDEGLVSNFCLSSFEVNMVNGQW